MAESFQENPEVVLALRSICPLKGEIDADSDIKESDVPVFILLGTRAPYPFNSRDTVTLPQEKAMLLAKLRIMARDIHTNKLKYMNHVDNVDIDEGDVANMDLMDIFCNIIDVTEFHDSDDESDYEIEALG